MPELAPASAPRLVLVVVAGGAEPVDSGTSLQEAGTPTLDRIARDGHIGRISLAAASQWDGFMRLLGQATDAPSLGWAEARAAGLLGGVPLGDGVPLGGWVARADFVTVDDEHLLDARGGCVDDAEADVLLAALGERLAGARLVRLDAHRNLWISDTPIEAGPAPWCAGLRAPRAVLSAAPAALSLFDASRVVLGGHDVNAVRVDLGENPANAVWAHGAGAASAKADVPAWARKSKVALVGAGRAETGIADALGWDAIPSAAGDDEALCAAALGALSTHDVVIVRTGSVLSAGALAVDLASARDARRDAFAALDARLVGPLLGALEERGAFALVVAADGGVDVDARTLSAEPVPFGVLSAGASGGHGAAAFHESACRDAGHDLRDATEFTALLEHRFAALRG